MTRVAVIRDPSVPAGSGGFAAIQTVAPSFGVELTPVGVHDADEIERGIAAFARDSNGGLIVVGPASSMPLHRDLIVTLAARHRLPAVYPTTPLRHRGGLVSYGPDRIDQYRRAAGYVDRILKGEKPADLPVQAPTKYELVSTSRPPRRSALRSAVDPRPRRRGDRMKLPRRQFLHLAAGAAALPAVSRIAWAQTYPTRPVRMIVGFPAGGAPTSSRA